jgi:hypothetical protein
MRDLGGDELLGKMLWINTSLDGGSVCRCQGLRQVPWMACGESPGRWPVLRRHKSALPNSSSQGAQQVLSKESSPTEARKWQCTVHAGTEPTDDTIYACVYQGTLVLKHRCCVLCKVLHSITWFAMQVDGLG